MVEGTKIAVDVAADEIFYRRVLPGKNHYRRVEDRLRISTSAFSDREFEPSVDRALIAAQLGGAVFTQQSLANGVLRLLVADVRGISVPYTPPKKEPEEFGADFDARPLLDNPAHYVIFLSPTTDKKKVFRRLLERLALLAQWELLPASESD